MARERVYRTEAVILKRSDVGEADRLLTVYTPEHGKLRVVAKGVRKTRSRKSGHVELFTHSNLLIAHGRTFDLITQAETIDAFQLLRADLDRTAYAYYIAELVDQFAEESFENRPVFDLLVEAYGWIGISSDLWLTARYVELHTLGYFGYQPQLHYCVQGDEAIAATDNFFDASRGGVLCVRHGENERNARPLSLNALKALRYMQGHAYADVVRTLARLTPPTRAEIEATLRRYITFTLERQLKSTDFLRLLERTA